MLPEQIQDKLIDIGNMVLRTSALDTKTKALIALSAATATFCSHCHGQFRSTAKKFGATEKEIEEAERLALRMRERCEHESGLFILNKPIEKC